MTLMLPERIPINFIPGEGVEFIESQGRTWCYCPTCKDEVKTLQVSKHGVETVVCENCFWLDLSNVQKDLPDAEFDNATIVCPEIRPQSTESVAEQVN